VDIFNLVPYLNTGDVTNGVTLVMNLTAVIFLDSWSGTPQVITAHTKEYATATPLTTLIEQIHLLVF